MGNFSTSRFSPGRALWLPLAAILGLTAVAAWLVAGLVYERALNEKQHAGSQRLQLYAANLGGELARYDTVPALLATHQRTLKVLKQPTNYSARQALNEYFEQAAQRTGALDVYLMNARGLTVAASNWQSDRTFIGKNFSFRPYFQQAMQGRDGHYFALGTTSRVRGYYFSSPVMELGHPVGAVVLKMDVERMERGWRNSGDQVLVLDPDGIVFISSEPRWLYHSLGELDPRVRERLVKSARYPGVAFRPLPFGSVERGGGEGPRIVSATGAGGRLLLNALDMPVPGWRILFLQSTDDVDRQALGSVGMVIAVMVALALMTILWLQGRARRLERARCDAESRAALEQAHAELEQRVAVRTADLQREVEERRRAESALRTAQAELVQAAKMAVLGQLSASINHELNQPLSAIRSYAENAGLLLERGRSDDVRTNLAEIGLLVDRMARISSQLKLFARKSDGRHGPVSLGQALDVSLKLLEPGIRRAGIVLHTDERIGDFWVMADATGLEQVLVNLLGNALNALEGEPDPMIAIGVEAVGGKVSLCVKDNGPGIAQAHLDQIFDPFFTTRKAGLGLGLAISQQIADNMGGRIAAANSPAGGAMFTLTLEQAVRE